MPAEIIIYIIGDISKISKVYKIAVVNGLKDKSLIRLYDQKMRDGAGFQTDSIKRVIVLLGITGYYWVLH